MICTPHEQMVISVLQGVRRRRDFPACLWVRFHGQPCVHPTRRTARPTRQTASRTTRTRNHDRTSTSTTSHMKTLLIDVDDWVAYEMPIERLWWLSGIQDADWETLMTEWHTRCRLRDFDGRMAYDNLLCWNLCQIVLAKKLRCLKL